MESKQLKKVNYKPVLKDVKSKHAEDKQAKNSIQALFSTFYLTTKEILSKISQLKQQTDFTKMKSIDLIKALKGTVFKTQLNKLCDIPKIIESIEIGFAFLQCDQCNKPASIACEGNQEIPYKLLCEVHLEKLGSRFQSSINLMHSLRYNKILLNELERYLIRLQERIDYFHIENDKKNPDLYDNVKRLIEINFEELKNLLESMTVKCLRICQQKTKTISCNSKMKYEYLTFIQDDFDKCKNTIFKILSMIPEVCDKIEADSLVQVIIDSNEGVLLEEETKESCISSIPDHIYEREYQLVHIPTQSLIQIKKLENKIKTNCKIIETSAEKIEKLMDTADSLSKMLADKLEEEKENVLEKDDSKNVLKQLNLRDSQFYIDMLKLKSKDAEYFRDKFAGASNTYKRVGQFDYGQPQCTADSIHICVQDNSWVYIGEVKEGTDDTPHGIGTKVRRSGVLREGFWKDGKLNGTGRFIDWDGDYYVGEYKEDSRYGPGTMHYDGHVYTGEWEGWKGKGEIYYKDGTKYIGEWDDDGYKKNGFGTLYSADGQVLNEGKWEQDKFVGKE